jgi:hypothetical protein
MKLTYCIFISLATLAGSGLGFPRQEKAAAIIKAFIARQAAREHGEEYEEARKVVAGDLNHDGTPDLAVLYTIEGQNGSNNYIQYLAVFVLINGGLVPAAHTAVGGKLRRGVELESIQNNVIRLDTMDYGPHDAACCPSRKAKTRYVLSKSKLIELRTPQAGN